jgi:glutaredoxin 2
MQERIAKLHARLCRPKHADGRFDHFAEQAAAMDFVVAQANDRQSKFYENFDRTEDARDN